MADFPALVGSQPVEFVAKAAAYTITKADNGKGFTNTGATAVVVLSLPVSEVGMQYYFHVADTDGIRIDPNGSETISLPSTGVPGAAGKYLTSATIGATVHLVCAIAGTWSVFGHSATWTAEP